jgi:hypothetical protein
MVRAWNGRRMTSVNQTRPHCVNQMGKTHSKPLAARHSRGTAWARHAMCESALNPQRHGMAGERHGHGMLCVNHPLDFLGSVFYGKQKILTRGNLSE